MTEKNEMLALADWLAALNVPFAYTQVALSKETRDLIVSALRAAAASAEPVAWRTRWKTGSERDREWEMWTYRTEQPIPNEHQTIESLYAHPAPVPASVREEIDTEAQYHERGEE